MTALDFLSQAYRLDLRIDSKLEQIASVSYTHLFFSGAGHNEVI